MSRTGARQTARPGESAAGRHGALIAAGLLVGLVISLGPSKERPDFAAAASFIDARAGTRDPYVEAQLIFSEAPELPQGPRLNFDRRHPSFAAWFHREAGTLVGPVADRRAWLAAAAR